MDVLAKTFETVLDVSSNPALFGSNRYIWQMHSSNDDNVHSATLRDGATFGELQRDGLADAARGAGDNGGLAGKRRRS